MGFFEIFYYRQGLGQNPAVVLQRRHQGLWIDRRVRRHQLLAAATALAQKQPQEAWDLLEFTFRRLDDYPLKEKLQKALLNLETEKLIKWIQRIVMKLYGNLNWISLKVLICSW